MFAGNFCRKMICIFFLDSEKSDFVTSQKVSNVSVGIHHAVAEHAWESHHPIHWEETTVLDHGKSKDLLVKEALHIQMTPSEEHFN